METVGKTIKNTIESDALSNSKNNIRAKQRKQRLVSQIYKTNEHII